MGFITQPELRSAKEIRREARAQLKGRWKQSIILFLIPIAISVIIGGAVGFQTYRMDFEQIESFESLSMWNDIQTIWSFVSPFIYTGISFAFLDMIRHSQHHVRPVKDAFQIFSKKYFVGVFMVLFLRGIFTILWTFLFIIPGIIKGFSYYMAPFIYKDLRDEPNEEFPSANDCIKESMELMDGHKSNLFFLQLSFIGWHLLAILSLGIGYIWLIPYMEMSELVFYENISKGRYLTEADPDKPYSKESVAASAEQPPYDNLNNPTDPDDFSDLDDSDIMDEEDDLNDF